MEPLTDRWGMRDVGAELRRAMKEQIDRQYGKSAEAILGERSQEAQRQLDEETLRLQDESGGLAGPHYQSSETIPYGSISPAFSPPQIQQFKMTRLAQMAKGMPGTNVVNFEPDQGPLAGLKRARLDQDAIRQALDLNPELKQRNLEKIAWARMAGQLVPDNAVLINLERGY